VWRGKFDGVRCAVLLLAFRKLNKSLQMLQVGFGMLSFIFLHSDALSNGRCKLAECVKSHDMHNDIAHALIKFSQKLIAGS